MESNRKDAEDAAQKKNPLEDLSKEELIKRYKNLLSIAQKAKQAKDEANIQVKQLEQELDTFRKNQNQFSEQNAGEKTKHGGKESTDGHLRDELKAMQEMLTALTDQKLTYTMEIDKLNKSNVGLKKQVAELQKNLEESLSRIDDAETAAESYKRQVDRLNKENEDLISHFSSQESELKTFNEHDQQLSAVKKPTSILDCDISKVEELEASVKAGNEEIERLNNENKKKNEQMKELYEKFRNESNELRMQLQIVNETLRKKNDEIDKLNEKLGESIIQQEKLKENYAEVKNNFDRILKENKELLESNIVLEDKIEAMDRENELVYKDVESIKANNVELKSIVHSIDIEKEKLLHENEKINKEKVELLSKLDEYEKLKELSNEEYGDMQSGFQSSSEKLIDICTDRNRLISDAKEYVSQLHNILQHLYQLFKDENIDANINVIKNLSDFVAHSNEDVLKNIFKDGNQSEGFDNWSSYGLTAHIYSQLTSLKDIISYVEQWKSNNVVESAGLKAEMILLNSKINENICSHCLQRVNVHEMSMSADSLELSERKGDVNSLQESAKDCSVDLQGKCEGNYEFQESQLRFKEEEEECSNCVALHKMVSEYCLNFEKLKAEHEQVLNNNSNCNEIVKNLQCLLKEKDESLTKTKKELEERIKDLQNIFEFRDQLLKQNAQYLENILQSDKVISMKSLEISRLIDINSKSEIKCAELTQILVNMKETLSKNDVQIQNLQDKLRSKEECILKPFQDIESSKLANEELQNEVTDCNQIDKLCIEIRALKTEIAEKEKNVTELQTEFSNLKDVNCKYSEQVNNLISEIKEQKELINKYEVLQIDASEKEKLLQREISQLTDVSSRQNEEITKLKQELMDKCIELKKYEELVAAENEKSIDVFQEEISQLKQEITNKDQELKECKDLITTNNETLKDSATEKEQSEISNLLDIKNRQVEEIKMLKNDLTNKYNELKRYEELTVESEKDLHVQKNEILKLTDMNDKLMEEVSILKQELENKVLELNESQELIVKARSSEKNVAEREKLLQNEVYNLKDISNKQIEEIRKLKQEIETYVESIKAHEKLTAENNKLFDELQSKVSNLNGVVVKQTETINSLKHEVSSKTDELNLNVQIFEDNVVKISELQNTVVDRLNTIDSLQLKVLAVESELEQCKEQYENAIQYNEKCSETIYKLEEDNLQKEKLIEDLQRTVLALKSESEERNTQYRDSVQCNEKSSENIRELEKQKLENEKLINDLKNEVEQLKSLHLKLEEDCAEQLRVANEHCMTDIEHLNDELVNIKNSHAEALGRLTSVNEELVAVQQEKDEAVNRITELVDELTTLRTFVAEKENTLSAELQTSKGAKENINVKLLALHDNLRELKQKQVELLVIAKEMKEIFASNLMPDTSQKIQAITENSIDSIVKQVKQENTEVLDEMNQMIHVLKQRGEVISKLNIVNDELEQKLQESSLNLTKVLSDRDIISKELEAKNIIIKDFETRVADLEQSCSEISDRERKALEKIQELETRMQKDEGGGEAQSEIMSTSTVSRAEEHARLKDVEESFEERYTKLRSVAVKLKKRSTDLAAEVKQLESDKSAILAEKTELQNKVIQLSAHAKTIQAVQQQYDNIQDEYEQQQKELKSLKKNLEELDNKYKTISQELQSEKNEKEGLRKDLEACKKDKINMEKSLRELRNQVDNTKKEKDNENKLRKEKEEEARRLEEEVKLSKKKLEEEIERHRATQEHLDTSKQELKKRSVLSLEMEDYEKSVTELTQQLTAERNKVKEIESMLDSQRDITSGLQEQIALLEQRIHVEETRCAEVKEQLNLARTRQSDTDKMVCELEATVSALNMQIEQHREQCENLSLQLAELAAEKQRAAETAKTYQESLHKQVQTLEDQVLRLRGTLKQKEEELANIQSEFDGYKIRAQSVLRQKTKVDEPSSFTREELLNEAARLRQTVDTLHNRLEETTSQLQIITLDLGVVQEERGRLVQQCQELSQSLSELREQHRALQEKERASLAEHREALRSQKIQCDTLTNCYKKQIEDLEERLHSESASLKSQLETALEELKQTRVSTPQHVTTTTSSVISSKLLDERGEIPLLEREDGEGSESTDTTSPQLVSLRDRKQEIIPLDKLLSPDEDVNRTSPRIELVNVKEQLKTSEYRINHLTGLLSEAEQDLAKLTQQNDLLKEEIRRHQRSEEREQHAQNFEYLKNVVVKFVTLQGGDERSRLVPVLSTILKLSPEEINQLNHVSKGGDLHNAGRSWGSYLPYWPSTS